MKRATPTLNRFITYTPNWWVNGLVLFAFFFLLDGCVDETSLAGFKKDPRMEVKFKEFSIPAVTVQADSIKSQNLRSSQVADRWLCGVTDNTVDPNFGAVKASIFTQIRPAGKIFTTDRTNFVLTKMTLNLVLDYYVYGDTLNSESTFSLHEITDANFNTDNDYFTNSVISADPTAIATASFPFKYDSLKKHITLNNDNISTNNVYDTVTFDIPVDVTFAQNLFDTLTRKGLYVKVKKEDGTDTLVYSTFKTDSVFLKTFKGLSIVPQSGNRVLGFTSRATSSITNSSRITIHYDYLDSGVPKTGVYYLYFQDNEFYYRDIPSYTRIEYDRSSTNISGLQPGDKYTDFNAPDNFCYVQSGTGLYTKLDFTEALDTFALFDKITFNSAELIIPVEPAATRAHTRQPSALNLKIVKNNRRLFSPPFIPYNNGGTAVLIPDPLYTNNYFSAYNYNDGFLDVNGDDNSRLNLILQEDEEDNEFYSGYLTAFFLYHSRRPSAVSRANFIALTPSTYFGKALDGVSFKKDQVKLRVYYSVPK